MNEQCKRRYLEEIAAQPLPNKLKLSIRLGEVQWRKLSSNNIDEFMRMDSIILSLATQRGSSKYIGFSEICFANLEINFKSAKYFCDGMGKSKVNQLKLNIAKQLLQF